MMKAKFELTIVGFKYQGTAETIADILSAYEPDFYPRSGVNGSRVYESTYSALPPFEEADQLEFCLEPDNPKDSAAIAVWFDDTKMGYIAKECQEDVHALLEVCDERDALGKPCEVLVYLREWKVNKNDEVSAVTFAVLCE